MRFTAVYAVLLKTPERKVLKSADSCFAVFGSKNALFEPFSFCLKQTALTLDSTV